MTRADLASAWTFEPTVVIPLAVLGVAYTLAVVRARTERGRRAAPLVRAAWFAAGWISLLFALVSPIDRLGETLFAGHMVQHLVLIVVAAPLLVIGAPPPLWLWLFGASTRRAIGRWLTHSRTARIVTAPARTPPAILAVNIGVLWFWHLPRPYQAAIGTPAVHALEHASFLGAAALFWWVVLRPVGRRVLGYGQAIIYIGIVLGASGALGALLMFSPPWYAVHLAGEQAWGMTPLADQQLAGLLMWIPSGAVYLGTAAALFLRWMASEEQGSHRVVGKLSQAPGAAL
ncbi:MAG: cytochrome c oxidase assembly protein [Gemmatimonadota bacterium]